MKISITLPLFFAEAQRDRLVAIGADYFAESRITAVPPEKELIERIGRSKIAVVGSQIQITKEMLQLLPDLLCIQSASIGLDHIDVEAAKSRGIKIFDAGDYSTESVAERALAAMLVASGRLIEAHASVRNGQWNSLGFQWREIHGKTLLIFGKGRIGKRVGEMCSALGMSVTFIERETSKDERLNKISKADYISLHCPYIKEIGCVMARAEFEAVKPGCIFVNTARGKLVNEDELKAALDSGRIEYAVLDVLASQPPEKSNPLLSHPKAIITPYTAWNSVEGVQRRNENIVRNLEHFVKALK